MNINQAIDNKFANNPATYKQVKESMENPPCNKCLVCGSKLVVPILRSSLPDYRIYCNHCGSEIPMFAVINQKAWRILARLKVGKPEKKSRSTKLMESILNAPFLFWTCPTGCESTVTWEKTPDGHVATCGNCGGKSKPQQPRK